MNYFRETFYKVSDYITFKSSKSLYKFLPHCFLFGAAAEFIMIKAPYAGEGETFWDVWRRNKSEKRWKALHGSLPQKVITEEETEDTKVKALVETAEEVQLNLLESSIETEESSSKTTIEVEKVPSEAPVEIQAAAKSGDL